MPPEASEAEPQYSAFLSYSRRDAAFAHRIHSRLESYRLPNRLVPHTRVWNPTTHRLKPLFRDLDEMTVAPDISDAIAEAIAGSAYLIVLCSPQSAQSDWVGREIVMFRAAHGDAAILAALVEGEPKTAFHPELLHGDGKLLQPLAADFRREGDGPRLAQLKLVAVMAGLGLGELVQRDAQRHMRRFAVAAAAITAILAIIAVLVVVTLRSRDDAARQSARAGAMSGFMLDKMRANLKRYGNVGMLEEVNRGVMESFRGRDLAGLNDAELQQLAKLRLALGEDAEQRGDLKEAKQQITEARRTTAARLAVQPDDPQRVFDHAQSEYYVALIAWRNGDRAGAANGFEGYRRLAQQLVIKDPRNPDWWMEVGYAENNLGMYTLRSTLETATAEAHLRSALAAHQRADRLRPGNRDAKVSISDSYAWLGDTLRIRGDFTGALKARLAERTVLDMMRAADPRDKQVQAYLIANMLAIARIADAQGNLRQALDGFSRGKAAAIALAHDDPDNVRRASQVRIFDLFMLRTWLTMPDAERPSAALLAAANGNCADDKKRLKSDELSQFCAILQARRFGTSVPATPGTTVNALSERWGLDFAKERALAQAPAG